MGEDVLASRGTWLPGLRPRRGYKPMKDRSWRPPFGPESLLSFLTHSKESHE